MLKLDSQAIRWVLQALAPRALLLVRLLLAGVVGALPSARQQDITDVLYAILKVRHPSLCGFK